MLCSAWSLLIRVCVGAFLEPRQVAGGSAELQSRAGTGCYHFFPVHGSRNGIKRVDIQKYHGFLKHAIFLHWWLFPFYLSIHFSLFFVFSSFYKVI